MTHRPAGSDEPPAAALLTGLLDPLLDARSQPSAEQFDALITAALADGLIGAELARELRFWQRASVHELADHVRTVLPAVLPVALAAVAASAQAATEAAGSASRAWDQARGPSEPVQGEATAADRVGAAAEGVPAEAADPQPEAAALDPAAPEDETAAVDTNPHRRRRLFVAGLTSTA